MGFCIVNNASVCARHAQRQLGLKRVLIIDFDVHHGNGTQDAFYSDPDVLFLSTHQAGSYPNTGRADEAGEGDGAGATVNVPLPGGCGDAAAAACAEEVIAPVAVRFRPDVILVSAGFDAHWRDPLAGLQFVGGTYHRLAAEIKRLGAGGEEGGSAAGVCAVRHCAAALTATPLSAPQRTSFAAGGLCSSWRAGALPLARRRPPRPTCGPLRLLLRAACSVAGQQHPCVPLCANPSPPDPPPTTSAGTTCRASGRAWRRWRGRCWASGWTPRWTLSARRCRRAAPGARAPAATDSRRPCLPGTALRARSLSLLPRRARLLPLDRAPKPQAIVVAAWFPRLRAAAHAPSAAHTRRQTRPAAPLHRSPSRRTSSRRRCWR